MLRNATLRYSATPEGAGMSTDVARTRGGQWAPGVSGNPQGRGVGVRNKFSETFVSDVAATWAKYGASVLEKMATGESARFAEMCSRLIPRDVQVSLSARMPGGLEPDDWQHMVAVAAAIKTALPDDTRQPSDVLNFVLEAIRAHSAKPLIE